MYIEITTAYYVGTEQRARRARFLILVQPAWKISEPIPPPRALVRSVSLRQCGHFMIGKARAFGETINISGAYGHDGLPVEVSDRVYENAEALPDELYEAWKNGGGWNSAGSEAEAMRAWALKKFPRIQN